VGLRHVAMPMGNGDPALDQQLLNAVELIVDQRLQGRDIEDPNAMGRFIPQVGKNGKERRLGFAAGG